MKKKVLTLALCLATTLSLFGCGNGDNNTEATETVKRSGEFDLDANDYVKSLGEYKGIAVTLTKDYTVSEDAVNEQINAVLKNFNLLFQKVEDKDTVEAGDYVEIDYVGYNAAGEAFQGGTSTSSVIMDVDNNYCETSGSPFIPGFCDKLVGSKVGTVVETPVTFPENYGNEELAGADCRFDITVKGIYRKLSFEEVDDAAIAENLKDYNIDSKASLQEFISTNMKATAENSRYSEVVDLCEANLLENSEVEVPSDYLDARLNEYVEDFTSQNLQEGQSLEDYMTAYGQDVDTVMENWRTSIEDQIKLEFIFLVIAEKEGIEFEQDKFDEFMQSYLQSQNSNFTSADDVYDSFGHGHKDEGEAYARKLFLIRQVITIVGDSAEVTDYTVAQ